MKAEVFATITWIVALEAIDMMLEEAEAKGVSLPHADKLVEFGERATKLAQKRKEEGAP